MPPKQLQPYGPPSNVAGGATVRLQPKRARVLDTVLAPLMNALLTSDAGNLACSGQAHFAREAPPGSKLWSAYGRIPEPHGIRVSRGLLVLEV